MHGTAKLQHGNTWEKRPFVVVVAGKPPFLFPYTDIPSSTSFQHYKYGDIPLLSHISKDATELPTPT